MWEGEGPDSLEGWIHQIQTHPWISTAKWVPRSTGGRVFDNDGWIKPPLSRELEHSWVPSQMKQKMGWPSPWTARLYTEWREVSQWSPRKHCTLMVGKGKSLAAEGSNLLPMAENVCSDPSEGSSRQWAKFHSAWILITREDDPKSMPWQLGHLQQPYSVAPSGADSTVGPFIGTVRGGKIRGNIRRSYKHLVSYYVAY